MAASSVAHADTIARCSKFTVAACCDLESTVDGTSLQGIKDENGDVCPVVSVCCSDESCSYRPSMYSKIIHSAHSTADAAGTAVSGLTRAEVARWEREGRRCPGSTIVAVGFVVVLLLSPLLSLLAWLEA